MVDEDIILTDKIDASVAVLTSLLDARDLEIRKLISALVESDKMISELSGGLKLPKTEESGIV